MTAGEAHGSFEASAQRVLRTLALLADGRSGADIERLVREAKQKARREKRSITYNDLEALIESAKPARSLLLRYRIAVHEAGHAVMRLYFNLGAISRISVGSAEGGYTTGSMVQDEQTEEILTAFLISTLAGRAAEEVVIGSVTASSGGPEHSDLAMATDLARDMETVLGFGKIRPLLYRKTKNNAAILAVDSELSTCVTARLDTAYSAAVEIVQEQRSALDFLTQALMDHEILEGPELERILEEVRQRIVQPCG